MARKVGEGPGRGCVGDGNRLGKVDERHIVEFGAADPLRLQDPEQSRRVQFVLGLRRQPPQLLGPGSPVAQSGTSARARASMAA